MPVGSFLTIREKQPVVTAPVVAVARGKELQMGARERGVFSRLRRRVPSECLPFVTSEVSDGGLQGSR